MQINIEVALTYDLLSTCQSQQWQKEKKSGFTSLQNPSTYMLQLEVKMTNYTVSALKQIASSSHEAGKITGSVLRGQCSTGAGYPQR